MKTLRSSYYYYYYLLLVVASVIPVLAKQKKVRTMPCGEAMDAGIFNPSPSGGEYFTGFPCGTTDFLLRDGNGGKPLDCVYYVDSESYECICGGDDLNCKVVTDAAIAQFTVNNQPCTAEGYELDRQVRTWWWECAKIAN